MVAQSADDVVRAVQQAVRAGKQLAVRGGGHCFENFVDHDGVKVLIDLSQLNAIDYDERHRAFSVGAGAILEQVYRELYYGWNVTVPGDGCLGVGVGVGGHFSGGGYGPLSRLHGSVVDHLYGVELVVVDRSGKAKLVTPTREGPHRDLWWAHTGGGGGNFGVVTRYLMRSPGTDGRDPSRALPRPPATLHSSVLLWDWKTVTKAGFVRTMRNFFDFYEPHSRPGSPYASLYSPFLIATSAAGNVLLSTQIDGSLPDAERLVADFHAAVTEGVSDPKPVPIGTSTGPFLQTTIIRSIGEETQPARSKAKAAYLRKGYTDAQLATIHRHLTDPSYAVPESVLLFVPYGGQVNAVQPSATASFQRDSIMKMVLTASWSNQPRTPSTSAGPGPSTATCTPRPGACRCRARSTPARTSTTRTSISPTRSGTPPACRGTTSATAPTTRGYSRSRRPGTRGTSSATPCRSALELSSSSNAVRTVAPGCRPAG